MNAQPNELIVKTDSLTKTDSLAIMEADTLEVSKTKIHLPRRATMLSAVLPGLGQIYNKQIWKVPIVYGGFIGFGIAIEWNNNYFHRYKQAYFDLTDGDASTTTYNDFNSLVQFDEFNLSSSTTNLFLNKIKYYRRQRSLVIIYTAAFYILNVLDANVNAHFIDFDISEDLSFNFAPVSVDPLTNSPIFGATLSYNF